MYKYELYVPIIRYKNLKRLLRMLNKFNKMLPNDIKLDEDIIETAKYEIWLLETENPDFKRI